MLCEIDKKAKCKYQPRRFWTYLQSYLTHIERVKVGRKHIGVDSIAICQSLRIQDFPIIINDIQYRLIPRLELHRTRICQSYIEQLLVQSFLNFAYALLKINETKK